MKSSLSALSAALLLGGCTTAVNLTLLNPGASDQQVAVNVTDPNGVPASPIALGQIGQGQSVTAPTFKVKHNSTIEVVASLPGGPTDFSSGQMTVFPKPDPLKKMVTISPVGTPVDTLANAQEIITDLQKLGPNVGFTPLTMQDALASVWGGLVCYSKNNPASPVLRVSPANFSSQVALGDVVYHVVTVDKTITVDGSSSTEISASVPLYGTAGVNTSSSSLSRVHYNLTGFGRIQKPDPTNWTLVGALNKLSTSDQVTITGLMASDADAACTYIDEMYAVQNALFDVTTGTKLAAGANVTAGSVVKGNAAYDFSTGTTTHTQATGEVVNAFGQTFRVKSSGGSLSLDPLPVGLTVAHASAAVSASAKAAVAGAP